MASAQDPMGVTSHIYGIAVGDVTATGAGYSASDTYVVTGNMTGMSAFTGLEQWSAGVFPTVTGSGTLCGDGRLHHAIAINGGETTQGIARHSDCTPQGIGGYSGTLTETSTGAIHERVAGTRVRDGLAAGLEGVGNITENRGERNTASTSVRVL